MSAQTVKVSLAGMLASIGTWFLGVFKWYSAHLQEETAWIVHVAQIGGLVVLYYSIKILRRNWKNGRNGIDPKA